MTISDRQRNLTVGITAGLFIIFATMYFLRVKLPLMMAWPLALLAFASVRTHSVKLTIAFFFSALGDIMGIMDFLLPQMGFFAVAHCFLIWFFVHRYFTKINPERRLSRKNIGYITAASLCVAVIVVYAIATIVPAVPSPTIKAGVVIYSFVIGSMLFTALMQRSILYAVAAVLFVFSDMVIAWNSFIAPVPNERYVIMVTYYLAQLLFYLRASGLKVGKEFSRFRL